MLMSLLPILSAPLLLCCLTSAFTTIQRPWQSQIHSEYTKLQAGRTTPVTLLGGFLGTGKTTLLSRLLEETDQKLGVIVNDVASINIDAKLISSSTDTTVQLQNGCVCCSLSDELFDSIDSLNTKQKQLDGIVVELSGVSNPETIQRTWSEKRQTKHTPLQKTVCLVDCSSFARDYLTWDTATERKDWTSPGDECAGNVKVSQLLCEQIEAGNVVVLNKCDLATEKELEVARKVILALNEKCELVETEYGKVDINLVLGPLPMSGTPIEKGEEKETDTSGHTDDSACHDPDCNDASHDHSHKHACSDPDCTDDSHSHAHDHADTSTDALGISSFTFTAHRPFSLKRLMKVLEQWPIPISDILDLKTEYEVGGRPVSDSCFIGVLRSKGFCWFAPTKWSKEAWRHDTAMYWSQAGRQFDFGNVGKWWSSMDRDAMKEYFRGKEDEYNVIMERDFKSDEFGDRRQEIVFIGTDLNESEICATLNSCLLTEKELDSYRMNLRNYLDTMFTPSRGLFGADFADLP